MSAPLESGQRLFVKRRSELIPNDFSLLQKLKITRDISIYVTHADSDGISLYVCRRPDFEAFIPVGGVGLRNWQSYFEAGSQIHPAYKHGRHVSRVFPKDFT